MYVFMYLRIYVSMHLCIYVSMYRWMCILLAATCIPIMLLHHALRRNSSLEIHMNRIPARPGPQHSRYATPSALFKLAVNDTNDLLPLFLTQTTWEWSSSTLQTQSRKLYETTTAFAPRCFMFACHKCTSNSYICVVVSQQRVQAWLDVAKERERDVMRMHKLCTCNFVRHTKDVY